MYDVLLDDIAVLDSVASPTDSLAVDSPYVVATIHRASTTDDPRRFGAVVHALAEIATNIAPVVWPVHPRTSDLVAGLVVPDNLHLISPVSYHEMLVLVRGARTVVTDSGGLQKEAYWLKTPCVTVRDTTEWTETIDAGWNSLVGADAASIIAAVTDAPTPDTHPSLYGDGRSADRIVDLITSLLA